MVTIDSDSTSLNDVIITLGGLFMVVVLPMFFALRYKTRRPAAAFADPVHTQEVWDRARRLETRIEHLERLLDAEIPGWRSRT